MSAEHKSRLNRRQALVGSAALAAVPLLGFGSGAAAAQWGDTLRLGRNQPFDQGWKFLKGEGQGFEATSFDDTSWRTVDLPHDWSIEDLPGADSSMRLGPFDRRAVGGGDTGFTVGGEGWYRKRFRVESMPAPAHVEVLFGGAYMESDVWLNGQHLGRWVNGYTPFGYDLTPHLRQGENVLAVRVRNLGKNSRWYTGSGLYRSVTLDVLPEASRVERWGVGVATLSISDDSAEIDVETRIAEPTPDLTLVTRIRTPDGRLAVEATTRAGAALRQTLNLPSPKLWSPSTPFLYTLETELRRGSKSVDLVTTPFGVRIVSFDAERGMEINGQPIKLRGGCVHHDNGLLGAAAHADAEDRRVRLLKARGFNAIRSSHNPSSQAFAEACDRHGVFLIEEAFDMWRTSKNPQDYSVRFAEHWKADVTAMVLSARNHPSVIMWSIGNEVPHRSTPEGLETSWNLANEVRRLDPTRPVTAAINGFVGRPVIADEATARKGFAGVPDQSAAIFLDVVGYNYKLNQYAAYHAQNPNRVIYGSETYPRELFDNWAFIDAHPHAIGDFVWAAIDYLGESAIGSFNRTKSKTPMPQMMSWPWVVSNTGDLDLAGRQKPQSLARDVLWGVSPLEIAVHRPLSPGEIEHISPWGWPDERQSWNWDGFEGQPLGVRVYSRADRIELRLNGTPAGSMVLARDQKLPVELEVPYAPGVLEAVAYRGGREIGRRRLETVGAPAAVRLTAEKRSRVAGAGERLSYVWVEVVDANGRVVPDVATKVALSVTGPAKLLAFGSANPKASGSFQQPETRTFDGRALAILKTDLRGSVGVACQGEALKSASISIQ